MLITWHTSCVKMSNLYDNYSNNGHVLWLRHELLYYNYYKISTLFPFKDYNVKK